MVRILHLASRPSAGQTAGVDPEPTFEVGSVNGREAHESGPRPKALFATRSILRSWQQFYVHYSNRNTGVMSAKPLSRRSPSAVKRAASSSHSFWTSGAPLRPRSALAGGRNAPVAQELILL